MARHQVVVETMRLVSKIFVEMIAITCFVTRGAMSVAKDGLRICGMVAVTVTYRVMCPTAVPETNMMKLSIKKLFPMMFLLMLVCCLIPLEVLAQLGLPDKGTQESGQSTLMLSTSANRVVFDAAPFSAGNVVPHWDKGYLISLTPETASPNLPNVRLYDARGQLTRQSAIWFSDAETVFILSTAVTNKGNIVASGTAVKADGTRAYFIAGTDASGKVTNVVQTNPFFPANICVAQDDTVWSFGDLGSNPETDRRLLRQFDLRKGLIASYLPDSLFGGTRVRPAIRGGDGDEVYFRCSVNRMVIYSGVSGKYLEFDPVDGSARQFSIDRSSNNLPVRGFALTDKGEAYGYLRDYFEPPVPQGLFHLDLDTTQLRARWIPVKGASGRKGQQRIISGLYGADGEALIHSFDDDPAGRVGISWSLINTGHVQ